MRSREKTPLSPAADAPPLSVGELAARIVRLLESGVGQVCVEGEVSNARTPASGHCYFVLKDASAAINAVCFRGVFQRQSLRPRDGQRLVARGRVSAYAPRSEYQIIVESMREAGQGDLMRRFLELKEKLKAEGLFDSERKRPIPRLPRRIGVVTSATGAALRDMLNVLARRARGLTIYLSPAAVQGDAAPAEIVQAIERLQRHGQSQVIIVGRGGGSIEDLWAFNDERVARAIAACPIPVISAVGHETDTTLADYAADLRAPTPSAAAELVSAHYGETADRLAQYERRLRRAVQSLAADRRARLERCASSWGLRKPAQRVGLALQRLDDLRGRTQTALTRLAARQNARFLNLSLRLDRASPRRPADALRARLERALALLRAAGPSRWRPRLAALAQKIEELSRRLGAASQIGGQRRRALLTALEQRLAALNPEGVLKRGYSIVTRGARGRVVTRPDQVRPGETVHIRSHGGPWRAAALAPEEDMFDQVS